MYIFADRKFEAYERVYINYNIDWVLVHDHLSLLAESKIPRKFRRQDKGASTISANRCPADICRYNFR